jgi:hypothetical protein
MVVGSLWLDNPTTIQKITICDKPNHSSELQSKDIIKYWIAC